MNDIPNVDGYRPTRSVGTKPTPSRRAGQPDERAGSCRPRDDRLELSELGRLLAAARDLPDIRVEKIIVVREQIEAGTYETADKIEITVDRLVKDLV